jgi:hypothetical protein
MRLVIGKEDKVGEQRPAAAQTLRLRSQHCPCGQQLDICGGTHCPRCGRSVTRH